MTAPSHRALRPRRAVHEAAEHLRRVGCAVVPWNPSAVPDAIVLAFPLLAADGGAHFKSMSAHGKRHATAAALLLVASRTRPALTLLRGLAAAFGQKTMAHLARGFGRSLLARS
jgi:hypothetical protein